MASLWPRWPPVSDFWDGLSRCMPATRAPSVQQQHHDRQDKNELTLLFLFLEEGEGGREREGRFGKDAAWQKECETLLKTTLQDLRRSTFTSNHETLTGSPLHRCCCCRSFAPMQIITWQYCSACAERTHVHTKHTRTNDVFHKFKSRPLV